jgi:hypothetical protein
MDDPKPIGEAIDEAMAGILGTAGNEFYAELVRQTRDNRERIEREARARFHAVVAEVFAELTGLHADPRALDRAARSEAHRRIQAEIGRRISEEETAFRERLGRLYEWARSREAPTDGGRPG